MKKLELTDRQWQVVIDAMSCYTDGVRDNLDYFKCTHNQEDEIFGGKFDERQNIYESAGELRACHNILEKLTGSKYHY